MDTAVILFLTIGGTSCLVLLIQYTVRYFRLQHERELAKLAAQEQQYTPNSFDQPEMTFNSNPLQVNNLEFSGAEGDSSNISRSEVTALSRMMNRNIGNQGASSPGLIIPNSSPTIPLQPEVNPRISLFPIPLRHASQNDLPPAYDEVLEEGNLLSKDGAPPEYSVYVIPSDHLPPPPQYSLTIGIR